MMKAKSICPRCFSKLWHKIGRVSYDEYGKILAVEITYICKTCKIRWYEVLKDEN